MAAGKVREVEALQNLLGAPDLARVQFHAREALPEALPDVHCSNARFHRADHFLAHGAHLKLVVGVLENEPRMRHEAAFAHGASADGERPFGLIEARENAGEGGFPRAVAPDQRRDACRHRKGRVREDGLFGRIGEGHAVGGEDALSRLVKRNRSLKDHIDRGKSLARIGDVGLSQTPACAKSIVPEHFPGARGFNPALRHYDHFVRDVPQPIEPVVDHQNGGAFLLEFAHRNGKRLRRFRI